MGASKIQAFLTHRARQGRVVLSTQNRALRAILFLYRQLLGIERPWLDGVEPAKKPQRLMVTLTPEDGCDMRTARKRLGHEGVSTTMSDMLMVIGGGRGVVSPLDR